MKTPILIFLLICVTNAEYMDAEDNNYNLPALDGRIVGGYKAAREEYPYQASLIRNKRHICGGVIVTAKFIITACHCVHGKSGNFRIYVGSTARYSDGDTFNVSRIFEHPKYNPATFDYDIAILKLNKSIHLGPSRMPIDLPSIYCYPQPGYTAFCSGWGRTSESGSSVNELRAVQVHIFELSVCKSYYRNYNYTGRMLCAGVKSGGKDACNGDSGGPLVSGGCLIGIVSWGAGCARPQYPGVYTNVNNKAILEYINEIVT